MNWTNDQLTALAALDSGGNVFLSGQAGTGKSTVINHWLNQNPEVVRLASTGIAAVQINGRTLHSFFGIGAPKNKRHALTNYYKKEKHVRERFDGIKGIVIDEISMVGGETFAALEEVARHATGSPRPWGGLQVITVGDFYQLKPIEDDWSFLTDTWEQSRFQPVILSEIMRTTDEDFIYVLNEIREGAISDYTEEYLNERLVKDHKGITAVRLFARNKMVDDYNEQELAKLSGRTIEFRTKTATFSPSCISYDGGYITKCFKADPDRYRDEHSIPASLFCEDPCGACTYKYDPSSFQYNYLSSLPIPAVLKLKIGAQVMVRKNHPDGQYINGTVGRVVDVTEDCVTIVNEKGEIPITSHTFEVRNGDAKVVFTGSNFPLALAWASSIHKSQGRSIDSIVTDLRGLWDPGQAYVALSRAKSGAGVHLLGWDLPSIKVDKRVRDFYLTSKGSCV